MENNIRISRSLTKITVNENGDTIELDLNDQEFVSRLVQTVTHFEEEAQELKKAHSNSDDLEMVANASIELCRRWKTDLDELLGDGTCEKVFGPITPGVAAFADFFDQLGDILNREQRERTKIQNEKVKKYTEKYAKHHKGG